MCERIHKVCCRCNRDRSTPNHVLRCRRQKARVAQSGFHPKEAPASCAVGLDMHRHTITKVPCFECTMELADQQRQPDKYLHTANLNAMMTRWANGGASKSNGTR